MLANPPRQGIDRRERTPDIKIQADRSQSSCAAIVLGVLLARPALASDWPLYAGGPRRLFFNPAETLVTAANVSGLHVKWTFPTGAIVTGSPAVVTLDLPGEGRTPAVEAACPCTSFDGTQAHGHAAYVHCVRRTLGTLVASARLRPRCHRRSEHDLTDSTCGRPGSVVCCQTDPSTRCLIVPSAACASTAQTVRESCTPVTACAATTCLSAGVCAAGG